MAGFRVVRRLGEGSRADVWLGHAAIDGRVAALKIFRQSTSRSSIDTELDALARCSSPHILELQDVGSSPDGRPCLILPRLAGPSLAALLAERERVTKGQFVTALAPIALALTELHRCGVAHGAVGAAAVILDSHGAPVLARFGNASVVAARAEGGRPSLTVAERAEHPALLVDRVRFAELVAEVGVRAPGSETFVSWAHESVEVDEYFEQAAENLFDLAVGEPIVSAAPITVPAPEWPAWASLVRPAPVVQQSVNQPQTSGWHALVENSPVTVISSRLRAAMGAVRRPIWVVGLVGLAAMLLGFAVVPALSKPATHPTPGDTPRNSAAASATPRPEATASLLGDDPVAAAGALIAQRAWCFTQVSAGCLTGVDQAGSAALDADAYFLRELQGGSTVKDRALDGSTITLVQRIGDTAIIGLGTPVQGAVFPQSVLLVKLDGGWRIRDLTTGASQ